MKKLLNWSKNNIFVILTMVLLIAIPLYPKIPTFDIYGTWVYIRLEDFLVLISVGVLFFTIIRNKSYPRSTLTFPIILYWIVGLISLTWSLLFIGKTLSNYYPHLVLLHYARRIEYMSVFFIAYLAIRKTGNLKPYIYALSVVLIVIVLYGLGQKLYGFPAFLTMNEEFAKGIPLRLPPTARIPSTFGGHYDLAAYLVFIIPILASIAFGMKKIWLKLLFVIFWFAGLGLLLLTASRVSFGVYLIAIATVCIWQKKIWYIVPIFIVSFVMLNFVTSASDRFYKTFRFSDVIVDLSTGKPIGTLDKIEGGKAVIETQENPAVESLPKGSEFINIPQSGKPTVNIKTVESFKSASLATGSGEIATISGSFLIQKALVYDISITTRFQGEWPLAIAAFKRNLLLGSGYSTLSVANDGDYLRMLGETGLLGTIAFLGIIIAGFFKFLRLKKTDTVENTFIIGVFAGIIGLSLNAVLIDVFEASKVAFTFWLILGLAIGLLDRIDKHPEPYISILYKVFTHKIAYITYLLIGVWLVYSQVLSGYFVGDDFTWLKWAAESTIRDIGVYFTKSNGFFYRPIPKLWYFLMYSVFWLKAGSYHLITLVLYSIINIQVFRIMRIIGVRTILAWVFTFIFGALAIHHENLFWISGHSSLLSALFFLFSMDLFLQLFITNSKNYISTCIKGTLFLIFGMFSYEGLIVGPIIIWLISIVYGKKKVWSYIWILLLIPAYWYTRQATGALISQGDYAINYTKFSVNSIVNSFGYFVSIFVGPKAVEWFESTRMIFKSQFITFRSVSIGLLILLVGFGYFVRSHLSNIFRKGIFGIFFCITLLPYIGLGGIAERYAFLASAMLLILGAQLAEFIWLKSHFIIRSLIFAVCIATIYWNIQEVKRVGNDWKFAFKVSETSLLTMKKEFFPIKTPTWFSIINHPIRYGRAWIFPTGMDDALWHLFRGSQYTLIQDSSISAGYSHQVKGSLYVLTYEDYVLKRVVREIQETVISE